MKIFYLMASSLSLKCIRLLLDSLPFRFVIDSDLSLSKANMKDIYKTDFFSVISCSIIEIRAAGITTLGHILI
ncbi:hypothetical protein H8356DRAFT_1360514 [Neocallimastix lanati (nom. inval.)]|nr:hypothetical protein H8356DRAFT_1360514 [Neocallimastix sp. JGI-2020a]